MPLDWRRFELVIFDLDGVLVATSDCHALAFDELWRRLGVEGPVVEDSELGLQAALGAQAHAVVVRGNAGSDSQRFLGRFPDLTTLADAMGVPR